VNEAELWGVLKGRDLVWECEFKKVELRVDSMVVVYTLKNGSK
jgi:ribonuclease HI